MREKIGIKGGSKVDVMERRVELELDGIIKSMASNQPPAPTSPPPPRTYAPVPCIPPFCTFECAPLPPPSTCSSKYGPSPPPPPPPHLRCPSGNVHPISISIPSTTIVPCVPLKDPSSKIAVQSSSGPYKFTSNEEHSYKASYRASYHGLTRKKSGCDCLRHYEILSQGSVPFFTDGFEDCTDIVMVHFPKEVVNDSKPRDDMSDEEYYCRVDYLLNVTRSSLTTVSAAKQVLETAGKEDVMKVLFLGGNEGVDYVRDSLLHGFKVLMRERGGEVVDFVRPGHMYLKDFKGRNEELYGLGYTYSHWIESWGDDVYRGNIKERLEQREFDLVVFGSVYRGMPFWEEVREHYGKEEIVLVDGEDEHGRGKEELWGEGWFFMREISEEVVNTEGCEIIR
ncbi:hypothetical protein TrVE_jg6690 [Triparma verrucosa]|uniref:Uncharacterized protein n=1 Tax=Triparma verrucosa TaxID=1606542 RepID=A0A9W7CGX9_9STRA|nr:hypothetical protein TrVE_jg6690 [Triparma verrucosa]